MKTPIYYDSRLVKKDDYLVVLQYHCFDCFTATVTKATPNFEILPALDFCFCIEETNPPLQSKFINYKKAAEKAIELYKLKIKGEKTR